MFRFLTAGESHGPALTAIIEGLPAGLELDLDEINADLARRQQGFGRGGRMKIEKDKADIASGVRFGITLGSPLTIVITNRDWENWQERMSVFGQPYGDKVTAPRPGHADLPGILKYQRQDIRDILERASARETATRVAVGSIAKQLLAVAGITITSRVLNIGGAQTEEAMINAIANAKTAGDSLGGIFEVIAAGIMPGLGSHVQWDRRLDTRLAAAVMSIQAIKGVEFGAGFAYANLPGSQVHDEIYHDCDQGYYRRTNNAGGIEGGISNGENIVLRAVMKAIPTLMKPLNTVNIVDKTPEKANTERSDVSAVPAAAVVAEAMAAIVLAQALLEKFGGDSIEDLKATIGNYQTRINK
ncbi:chorismate synthase [Sporomusa sp.]|uniref:chorismate synthase n=1 Tax=Sporomusa sp. TaxID=2078658 RepID=UPI002B8B752E|nr:chorismate synthase [Sporomusa sp.]HWR43642.1 chorismate synthase [Sporomusa sp.]